MTVVFDAPLALVPHLEAKQWGGRRLAGWGKHLPAGQIGESLESGNAARVRTRAGDELSLGELARTYPDELLGPRGRAVAGDALDFPLLVKFIDAEQHLSVQVHPSDAQAPAGRRGKCEAWLILEAEPGAELVIGLRGKPALDTLQQQLVRRVARPGDVYLVPPGTVHAVGAGVLLYEIQQPSDVTYRIFDWGRQRELHVVDGLAHARLNAEALAIEPLRWRPDSDLLVACPFFALERRIITSGQLEAMPDSCRVLTLLKGSLTVGVLALKVGDSVVLPATLPAQPLTGAGVGLIAWAPDVERDIAQPLRNAGIADARIFDFTGAGICT